MLPKNENAPAGVTAPAEAAGTGLQATAPATMIAYPHGKSKPFQPFYPAELQAPLTP